VPTQQYEKADGIEQCRNLFPRIIFEQARGQMALLIEALRSYRKKFDERLRVFSTTPLHDWSSHPADAFSIMCWNIKRRSMIREKPLPTMAIDDPEYRYL
jgi:hypothetical protein